MERRNCDGCNKEIYVDSYRIRNQEHHFCTNDCYKANIGRYRSTKITLECETCGKSVLRKPSEIKNRTFCGVECYRNRVVEKSVPKGKLDYSCEHCGKVFKRFPSQVIGRKRLYCSRRCQNDHLSVINTGENHPRWNPELTEEDRILRRQYPAYLKWRTDVFGRDSFTCKCCGDSKGGNLVSHHIYNYSEHLELRTAVINGVTMCEDCHKDFHDTHGYTGNNLAQLIQYFEDKGGDQSALFALEGTLIPSQAC